MRRLLFSFSVVALTAASAIAGVSACSSAASADRLGVVADDASHRDGSPVDPAEGGAQVGANRYLDWRRYVPFIRSRQRVPVEPAGGVKLPSDWRTNCMVSLPSVTLTAFVSTCSTPQCAINAVTARSLAFVADE